MKKLVTEICKREGKKSQARIGDVREILAIVTDIFAEEQVQEKPALTLLLIAEVEKKAAKLAKKAKR